MKITDEYLREALPEAMDAYIKEVEADSAPRPSPEFQTRVDAIVQEQRARAWKQARRSQPVYRFLRAAAVVLLLVLAVGGFGLSMTVQSNRQALVKIRRKVHAEYTDLFIYSQTSDGSDAFAQAELTWLPEGFEKTWEDKAKRIAVQRYMNQSGDYIQLEQTWLPEAIHMTHDTEDARVREILVQGVTGYLVEKEDRCDVVWVTEEYVFCLSTTLDAENAVRIAEHVNIQ